MSFNIEYSHTFTGFVTVKVPTVALDGAINVNEAPFRLLIATQGQTNHSFETISSNNNWTAQPSGDFTVYTRTAPLEANQTFELYPLSTSTITSDFYFPPTGFAAPSNSPYSVSVEKAFDNTAPTLAANGIEKVQNNANGTSLLGDGKESAYTVSFSERVTLPLSGGQSLFGGVPPGSSFILTPMNTPTIQAAAGATSSDLWHVKVTTPTVNATVNLTLTPKLQVATYETTNAAPPPGTQVFGFVTESTKWAKVTLDGDLYEGRDFAFESGGPVGMSVVFMSQDNSLPPGSTNTPIAAATSTSAKNVLYLGFPTVASPLEPGYEVKIYDDSSSFAASPLGGPIADSSGNQMVYASIVDTTSPMEPFESVLTNGTIGTFVSEGTRNGFEVLDMHLLTQGPLIVDAEYGFMTVYDAANTPRRIEIDFYDKYILNDRVAGKVGNTFYGTDDSEYVVVGNGGDNYLLAGNQVSGSMAPETDIVDYSNVTGSGITVDLGNSASNEVYVFYTDLRRFDTISGFEGVVGSDGNDYINGSNVGNYLNGGDGNDILRGYSENGPEDGDLLYDGEYFSEVYVDESGLSQNKWMEFLADSSDLLVGGKGTDTLYGGAGSDFLVDLDAAVMWGSDVVTTPEALRDNNDSDLAEYDVFMVRGTTGQTATIENFHLSKNGTGLAGRSYDSHDSIVFSTDIDKLIRDAYTFGVGEAMFGEFLTDDFIPQLKAGMGEALYHYVYDNLTFTQTQVGATKDMKLTATFLDDTKPGYTADVGEVIIADLVTALGVKNPQGRFANQADVVELGWLADRIVNYPDLFNLKMDLDIVNMDKEGLGWSFDDLEIAVALELLQAGTVREANEYGVMASNLDDMSLDERIFNPDNADNTILGSAGKDIYDFIVQDFDLSKIDKDFDAGDDTIFDVGGADDILAFSEAKIDELTFSAVQVGRESGRSSLRIDYEQTLNPGNPTKDIKNSGEITWQGHFREGGRQAAEFVEVSNGSGGVDKYAMAKTEYQYDRKGYVIAGSDKVVAKDTFNAIMVGRNDGADEFVFKATSGSTQTHQQKASIAGFDKGDSIDISSYVTKYGTVTLPTATEIEDGKVELAFGTGSNAFSLELAFQDPILNSADLLFLLNTQ